jgi:hypothetical protein
MPLIVTTSNVQLDGGLIGEEEDQILRTHLELDIKTFLIWWNVRRLGPQGKRLI